MSGKTHLIFGIGIGALGSAAYYIYNQNILESTLLLCGSAIGSLFPDLDSPKAMLSKHIPFIPTFINKLFGHRCFFHCPIFLLMIYSFSSYYFNNYKFIIYGFTLGFLSHILLDMYNKAGIPLFYPFSRKRFHILKLRSGAKHELMYALGTYLLFFILFIYSLVNIAWPIQLL